MSDNTGGRLPSNSSSKKRPSIEIKQVLESVKSYKINRYIHILQEMSLHTTGECEHVSQHYANDAKLSNCFL